jgi:hypothetical protein
MPDKKDCNVPFNTKTECISSKYSPADVQKLAQDCGIDTKVVKNKKDQCNELAGFISKKTDSKKAKSSKVASRKVSSKKVSSKKTEVPVEEVNSSDCNIPFDKVSDCQKALYKPDDIRKMSENCGVDISIHKTKKAQCNELVNTKKSRKVSDKKKKEKEEVIKNDVENMKEVLVVIDREIKKIITDYLNQYIISTSKAIKNVSKYIEIETDKVLEALYRKEDLSRYENWSEEDLINFIEKYSDLFVDYPISDLEVKDVKKKKDVEKDKTVKEKDIKKDKTVKEKDILVKDIDDNLYNLQKNITINDFASIQNEILKCLRV